MRPDRSITSPVISVVIPAFKVSNQLHDLVKRISFEISHIIVVDDFCPENSGNLAQEISKGDTRVKVFFHEENLGVGGAMKTGYKEALNLGSNIIIKLDGDGQMYPEDIKKLIQPILDSEAEYVKGNRFFDVGTLLKMPKSRIIGNLALSFFSKISSGYWMLFDPNNGFTAVESKTLEKIPLHKIDNRYFFESDMLFRLNLSGARVVDVDIPARYGNEKSNLSVTKSLFEFTYKHLRNFLKRIIYSYFLRDFTLASLELLLGSCLLTFGSILAIKNYFESSLSHSATPTGTLILITMSILSGIQFLLGFFSYDIQMSTNQRKNRSG